MIGRLRLLGLTLLLLAAFALPPTPAAAYVKPQGVPTYDVPGYNVTIAIWAEQTPVGHGITIFELQNGDWKTCGQCVISIEYPTMNNAVAALGGPEPYVIFHLPAINAVLAMRYPPIGGPPMSVREQVTQVLNGYFYAQVNGAPALVKP